MKLTHTQLVQLHLQALAIEEAVIADLHRRTRARLRGWLWRTLHELPTPPDPRPQRTQGWVSW